MTNNTPDYKDNLYFEEKKMTDLTEKWKKGELPEGVYYCNTGNTVEILFTWGKNYHLLTNNKDEVYIPEMDDCDEIIAPVPSYEELQNMNEAVNQAIAANIKLMEDNKRLKHDVGNLGYKIKNQRHEIERQIAQNAQLKELLKRVNEHFKWVDKDDPFYVEDELWQKIKEELEKNEESKCSRL